MDIDRVTARQLKYLDAIRAGTATAVGLSPFHNDIPSRVAQPKADSFLLALAATQYAHGAALDAFAGSGIVGFWILPKCETVRFVDISEASVIFINSEIEQHPRHSSMMAECADVASISESQFDTIVANPPYSNQPVESEVDRICFDPGHRSLRQFIAILPSILRPKGKAFVSWASFNNAVILTDLADQAGLAIHVVATLEEPPMSADMCPISYYVYRLMHRPCENTDA